MSEHPEVVKIITKDTVIKQINIASDFHDFDDITNVQLYRNGSVDFIYEGKAYTLSGPFLIEYVPEEKEEDNG